MRLTKISDGSWLDKETNIYYDDPKRLYNQKKAKLKEVLADIEHFNKRYTVRTFGKPIFTDSIEMALYLLREEKKELEDEIEALAITSRYWENRKDVTGEEEQPPDTTTDASRPKPEAMGSAPKKADDSWGEDIAG